MPWTSAPLRASEKGSVLSFPGFGGGGWNSDLLPTDTNEEIHIGRYREAL